MHAIPIAGAEQFTKKRGYLREIAENVLCLGMKNYAYLTDEIRFCISYTSRIQPHSPQSNQVMSSKQLW